ncbi:MAG: methyltransferase domain-containing protein [Campylobacterales bacterium]|nr:methyltransferase domain-containing protein [Campylobacterales bacterium]MBN2832481.1 methyltransferase domain-containing protein [Campylobacterales bacterium]
MPKTLNSYLTMLLVPYQIEVLAIALHVKLFQRIEEQKCTAEDLALILAFDPTNTKIFLDALVMLELIEEDASFYANTDITKTFFIFDAPKYCGDVFLHRKAMLHQGVKMLEKLLKEGNKEMIHTKHPQRWAQASKKFLKQEQKNLISHVALKCLKHLPSLPDNAKILDIGCASGIVGLEILQTRPSWHGVFFDYPEVIEIVQEHIEEYALKSRTTTLCGDVQMDDIGYGYDLIWCSNLFYFFENPTSVIEKLYNALNPNGILISAHVEIDITNSHDTDSFFYFLFLNLQGKRIFKPTELSVMFNKAGFEPIQTFTSHDTPMTPTTVHILKKEAHHVSC